jgi:hypothetical protein
LRYSKWVQLATLDGEGPLAISFWWIGVSGVILGFVSNDACAWSLTLMTSKGVTKIEVKIEPTQAAVRRCEVLIEFSCDWDIRIDISEGGSRTKKHKKAGIASIGCSLRTWCHCSGHFISRQNHGRRIAVKNKGGSFSIMLPYFKALQLDKVYQAETIKHIISVLCCLFSVCIGIRIFLSLNPFFFLFLFCCGAGWQIRISSGRVGSGTKIQSSLSCSLFNGSLLSLLGVQLDAKEFQLSIEIAQRMPDLTHVSVALTLSTRFALSVFFLLC